MFYYSKHSLIFYKYKVFIYFWTFYICFDEYFTSFNVFVSFRYQNNSISKLYYQRNCIIIDIPTVEGEKPVTSVFQMHDNLLYMGRNIDGSSKQQFKDKNGHYNVEGDLVLERMCSSTCTSWRSLFWRWWARRCLSSWRQWGVMPSLPATRTPITSQTSRQRTMMRMWRGQTWAADDQDGSRQLLGWQASPPQVSSLPGAGKTGDVYPGQAGGQGGDGQQQVQQDLRRGSRLAGSLVRPVGLQWWRCKVARQQWKRKYGLLRELLSTLVKPLSMHSLTSNY